MCDPQGSSSTQSVCPISTAAGITVCASGPSIRAVEVALQEGLTSMDARRGWTRVGPECYVLKSHTNNFVDTTLAPFTEVLWKRTTLCERAGKWFLEEYAEDVGSLAANGGLAGPVSDPHTVRSMLTFAYNDASLTLS